MQVDETPRVRTLYAYCLARTDLPSLGKGKALAHAMHAGNHLTWTLAVEPAMSGERIPYDVLAWHRQGGGFGTTSAIGGDRELPLSVLEAVVKAAKDLGHEAGIVVDETYPYLVDDEIKNLLDRVPDLHTAEPVKVSGGWICCRRESTVGWILGDKSELSVLLRRFSLVAND
jgi:hypothetical protein